MVGSDYYSCDKCFAKAFYDAEVEYEGVGQMRVLCAKCAETHRLEIVESKNQNKQETVNE